MSKGDSLYRFSMTDVTLNNPAHMTAAVLRAYRLLMQEAPGLRYSIGRRGPLGGVNTGTPVLYVKDVELLEHEFSVWVDRAGWAEVSLPERFAIPNFGVRVQRWLPSELRRDFGRAVPQVLTEADEAYAHGRCARCQLKFEESLDSVLEHVRPAVDARFPICTACLDGCATCGHPAETHSFTKRGFKCLFEAANFNTWSPLINGAIEAYGRRSTWPSPDSSAPAS